LKNKSTRQGRTKNEELFLERGMQRVHWGSLFFIILPPFIFSRGFDDLLIARESCKVAQGMKQG